MPQHVTTDDTGPLSTGASSLIVAANDAQDVIKARADYVCDGTADNVQIQAALDALPAGGGKIQLSEGTFNIATSVEMIGRQEISGMGKSTILKAIASFNSDVIISKTGQANLLMTIEELKIDGNRSNNTAGCGIKWFGARNSNIKHVWLTECDDYAIQLTGNGSYLGWFNRIESSDIDQCDAGVNINNCEHNWFTRNQMSWIDGKGMYLESDMDMILDNQFDHCGSYTIHCYFGAGLWHIANNFIDRPQDHGIVLSGAHKSSVIHNYFDTIPSNRAAIVNGLYNNAYEGSNNCIISHNKVTQTVNSGSVGILENAPNSNSMYDHNLLTGVATPITVHASSTGLIRDHNTGD